MQRGGRLFLLSLIAIVILAAGTSARQQSTAQATEGRALYQTNCAGCHMPDLAGRNEAPALTGATFNSVWGKRSPQDLLQFIRTTMPPSRAGSLPARDYENITAF